MGADPAVTAVYAVEAYSYASRFVLREAAGYFPEGPARQRNKTQLVVEWSRDSVAFAFDFGALVFINVPPAVRDAVLETFARNLPREPHAPLREDFLIEVRPGSRIAVEMTFDRVVVPEVDPITLEVIATVIAQSVALDYYDEDMQAILDRLGAIAVEVAKEGRPRGRRRDLVRFVGAAIASQVEVISSISLLDKPDLTWEDEHADRLHDRLRYHFEIAERYRALEAKLLTVRESLTTLLELGTNRRMLFVEVTVVLLIALEIVLGLLRAH